MMHSKSAIVETIYTKTIYPKVQIAAILDLLSESISTALASGEDVLIPGVGKLVVTERAERMGHNPSTGEAIKIPASKSVKFKPLKVLKDKLNK